jgi:hypothetical protein
LPFRFERESPTSLARLYRTTQHQRLMTIGISWEAIAQVACVQRSLICGRQSTQPHQPTLIADTLMELHQLLNQAVRKRTHIVQFQNEPMGRGLLEQMPDPIGELFLVTLQALPVRPDK